MIVAGKTDGSKIADDAAEAMDLGEYLYVLTGVWLQNMIIVVIQKSKMRNKDSDMQMVKSCQKENYKFVASNEKYALLIRRNAKKNHLRSRVPIGAIGIGDNVHQLAMIYPQIYEGTENNRNTVFRNCQNMIRFYLSGFTYDDKDAAEKNSKRYS